MLGLVAKCRHSAAAIASRPGTSENPQPAVAVAAEDDRLSVADERLDAPEVVAIRIKVAADLDELTIAAIALAADLERPEAAPVVRLSSLWLRPARSPRPRRSMTRKWKPL